ncbi:MAG: DUF3047 domain-containing protein [candidate division NC10 bacterium]|nr:DUF3047 domain-containing protein [candidate division NC10 bacterium]
MFLPLFLLLAAAPLLHLLDLSDSRPGDGLPDGWKVKPVKGQPAPEYLVLEDGGGLVLRVSGQGAAAWANRELADPIEPAEGRLRWSWRVLELPRGGDLRDRAADDSAIRVYVIFGKPGGLFGGSGRIVFYTWGNAEPDGLTLRSFVSDRIQIVRVAGEMEADSLWRDQEIDPFADYRRFWRRDPPGITAVGIMQDTDMTRAMAVAEFRGLRWEPGEGS